MDVKELKERLFLKEIVFTYTRSSGPGGQNLNKVNTKVELRFNVLKSLCLSDIEKDKILIFLNKKINSEGELFLTSQSERTQLLNKKKSEEKFFRILASALTEKKKRKSTLPTRASKEERLDAKKKRSLTKKFRRDAGINED